MSGLALLGRRGQVHCWLWVRLIQEALLSCRIVHHPFPADFREPLSTSNPGKGSAPF